MAVNPSNQPKRIRTFFLLVGDSVPFDRFSPLLHVSGTSRRAWYEPETFVNSATVFESKFMPLGHSDLSPCPFTAIPWYHRRDLGLPVPCQANCASADSMSAASSIKYCIYLFDACLVENPHAVCGFEKGTLNLQTAGQHRH